MYIDQTHQNGASMKIQHMSWQYWTCMYTYTFTVQDSEDYNASRERLASVNVPLASIISPVANACLPLTRVIKSLVRPHMPLVSAAASLARAGRALTTAESDSQGKARHSREN